MEGRDFLKKKNNNIELKEKEQKEKRYRRLYEQILQHMGKTEDKISKMSTIIAILHNKIRYYFWTGFYFLKNYKNIEVNTNENIINTNIMPLLVVGPYQGSLACLTLKFPDGVCWASVIENKTLIVDDVHKFPGHIPCDSRSNSEIVVPVYDKNGKIYAVFDIDSDKLSSFDEIDKKWLEKIVFDFLR